MDRPVCVSSSKTDSSGFVENHNFRFGGDGEVIVLTPRLGRLHHFQELSDGGDDQTKIVHI